MPWYEILNPTPLTNNLPSGKQTITTGNKKTLMNCKNNLTSRDWGNEGGWNAPYTAEFSERDELLVCMHILHLRIIFKAKTSTLYKLARESRAFE
jgi:hypothetical protein